MWVLGGVECQLLPAVCPRQWTLRSVRSKYIANELRYQLRRVAQYLEHVLSCVLGASLGAASAI
jgi:hypothetical protein